MVKEVELDLVQSAYGPALRLTVKDEDYQRVRSDVLLEDIFKLYDKWKESQRG